MFAPEVRDFSLRLVVFPVRQVICCSDHRKEPFTPRPREGKGNLDGIRTTALQLRLTAPVRLNSQTLFLVHAARHFPAIGEPTERRLHRLQDHEDKKRCEIHCPATATFLNRRVCAWQSATA